MKKFLAIALTLCMLFTSVVFVSADNAAGAKVVTVTNADDGTAFMSGDVDTEVKAEGAASQKFTAGAGDKGVAEAFHIELKLDTPVDITGMGVFAFELYVSNAAAINGKQTYFELCSGGSCDVEENATQFYPEGLVDGWNTVVIDMGDFSEETAGGLDASRFNYFRWFNQATISVPENFQMNIDNVRFCATAKDAVVAEDIKTVVVANGDDDTCFLGGELDTEVKAEGTGSRKFTAAAGEQGVAAVYHIEIKPEAPIDITGMKFLVFELYVSNAAAITGKQSFVELTSSGTSDQEENATQFFPADLVDGWNTVVLPVEDFTEKSGGELDPTRLNYIRWFNNASITVPENFQMNLDNVRFMEKAPEVEGGDVEESNVEEHVFRVFEASEEAYFVRSSAGKNDNQRFSDHNGETVYKFTITNRYGVNKVTFTAMVNAQLLLQVSQDDANWTDVYKWELPAGTPANKGLDKQPMTFDLTEFVDLEACADIYIRFADSHPVYVEGDVDPDGNPGSVGAGHGWGGSIHKGFDTTLAVEYTPLPAEELDAIEAASDENSVAVFGFNTKFGGMTIDKENKRAGSACANFDVHLGGVHQKKFDTPIDASGMDTLTFDLYVSDLALFDMFAGEGMNSGLELTSSGDADYQEVSWKLAGIRDRNIGDEIVVGWNHIILPLETADVNPGGDENNDRYGDFDISRIDFIRFFMVNEATDAGITLKIDNMRLDNSGIARAEAKAAADKAAADKVVERINKIGEVTLDSIRAIEKAEGEYAELTAEQQALVSNYDVLTAARAKYDELKAAEDNKPSGDENKPSDETTGEDEKPADENKPTDEKPVDEEGGSNVVIIIVVVAVVVVAAVVVVIILAKKKNKK